MDTYGDKSFEWWCDNMDVVFDGVTVTKAPQTLSCVHERKGFKCECCMLILFKKFIISSALNFGSVLFPFIFAPNSYQHPGTNRSKFDEKPTQIDKNSSKIHSWAVFGAESRFRDAPGRVRDKPRPCQSPPGVDLGTPRARRGRPGGAQRCPQNGFKTLPGPSGATSARRRHDQHRRTCQRCDF